MQINNLLPTNIVDIKQLYCICRRSSCSVRRNFTIFIQIATTLVINYIHKIENYTNTNITHVLFYNRRSSEQLYYDMHSKMAGL